MFDLTWFICFTAYHPLIGYLLSKFDTIIIIYKISDEVKGDVLVV